MPETALVEKPELEDCACIGKTEIKYVFVFGKHQYYIPAASVLSYPKKPNMMESREALGALLATKAPDKWKNYTHPDFLMHIKGKEGSCVFTTFHVDDHMEEQRFVRFISGSIAEKCFPYWIAEEEKKRVPGEEIRESKAKRLEVLKWNKKEDCPERAQISPELNSWPNVEKVGVEDPVKSCKVDPESRKRKLPVDGNKDVDNLVQSQQVVKVGPPGSYTIVERPGHLHVIQYHVRENDGTGDAQLEEGA